MKILIAQDWLRSGGTERQSILLANAFARLGHGTTLLTFRPGGALAATVAPAVQRRVLQPFDLGLDWFAPGLADVARSVAPGVVLCMGRMANCHAGGLQQNLPGTPVVATMRTGKPLPWLFRRSLGLVRHVIANSRDARDTLTRRYQVDPTRVAVIHNSLVFPPESGRGRDESRRAQLGATAATTVFLCVAMFRPEKNQRELIEIVRELPAGLDWQLWLAGDGPGRAECEERVARLNLGGRIKFLGFHRDPSPWYHAADVAVHASWSEALSNFLIEGQAHGLPVVAYQAQGIEECFVPGETGWAVARDDRVSFREALGRLASAPPARRATLAAAARTFARTTFDPDRQVSAYLGLFTRLTAESA